MEEDLYVLFPDSDAVGDSLDDLAPLLPREFGPAGMKAPGFGEDMFAREPADPQHIEPPIRSQACIRWNRA
jgi:hypothetical protein